MLKKIIPRYVSRKKVAEISEFLGGRPRLISRLRGTPPPPLPAFGALARYCIDVWDRVKGSSRVAELE